MTKDLASGREDTLFVPVINGRCVTRMSFAFFHRANSIGVDLFERKGFSLRFDGYLLKLARWPCQGRIRDRARVIKSELQRERQSERKRKESLSLTVSVIE